MKSKSVFPALFALVLSASVDAQMQNGASVLTSDLARFDQQWQEAVATGDAEFIEKRTADSFPLPMVAEPLLRPRQIG
jgi:hypothetical protein